MNAEPIVSLDWLQFFVDLSCYQVPYYCEENLLSIRTRTFSEVCSISIHGNRVAQICRKPYSSVISPTCGTLKIENEYLYVSNAERIIEQVLKEFNIRILSVTRVDICGDFERICNRQPSQLIKDLINGEVLKVGHAKFYAHGEDLWKAKGVRQIGENTWVCPNSWEVVGARSSMKLDYLRYGSNSSNVCCYLYNKSKELREVKDKPYIRCRWGKTHADVWRLEFSIKGRRMSFIEKESGVVLPQDWKLYLSGYLCDMYTSLALHYFNIRENTGQVRKDRERLVPLWQGCVATHVLADIHDKHASNRSDRIFVGKLYEEMLRASKQGDIDYAVQCQTLAMEFIASHDLRQWAVKKGYNFVVRAGQGALNLNGA